MTLRVLKRDLHITYISGTDEILGFVNERLATMLSEVLNDRVECIPEGSIISIIDGFDNYKIYDDVGNFKFVVVDPEFEDDLKNGWYGELI